MKPFEAILLNKAVKGGGGGGGGGSKFKSGWYQDSQGYIVISAEPGAPSLKRDYKNFLLLKEDSK